MKTKNSKMEQKSLVLLKPDAVQRNLIGEIIGYFEEGGLKVEAMEMTEASDEIVSKHYPLDNREYLLGLGHQDVSGLSEEDLEKVYQKNYKIVKDLQDYIKSGPIVKMILGGREDVVAKVREIVGKTNPAASPKGSIRGDLGEDSFEISDKEGRAVYNLVHASGTPEEAEAEIALWFGK